MTNQCQKKDLRFFLGDFTWNCPGVKVGAGLKVKVKVGAGVKVGIGVKVGAVAKVGVKLGAGVVIGRDLRRKETFSR